MRLFIGILLPEPLQRALRHAWDDVASKNPARQKRMRSSQWHVTIAFLDDVDEGKLSALKQLTAEAMKDAPTGGMTIESFATFPKRHPTRIVATVSVQREKEWQKFVQQLRDMVSLAAPHVDRKPWVPHISMTRTLRGMYLEDWSEQVKTPIPWTPKELAILRSTPGPEGSTYTPLHVYPLNI